MIRVLFTLFFCLGAGLVFSQTNGDYRTRAAGNWNQPSTWEVFNGGWQQLSSPAAGPFQNIIPSHNSGVITLTHVLALTHSLLTLNQTIIAAGGRLNVLPNRTVRLIEDSQTPLTVNDDGILSVNGTVDLTQLTTASLIINGMLTSNGVIAGANSSRLIFADGSVYDHAFSSGGSVPTASWNINSLCQITRLINPNPASVGNLNQSFGNFLWYTYAMGATNTFSLNGQLTTVNGDLILRSTGTLGSVVRFDNSGPGNTLTIGGDLIIEGGSYTFAQNQSSTATITIGGDFIMSGGFVNLSISNSQHLNIYLNGNFLKTGGLLAGGSGSGFASIRFDGAVQSFSSDGVITGPVHWTVENGSNLDLGTSALTGSGTFFAFAGSTFNVKSLDPLGAIQNGTAGGNIRLSGTRLYQPGSTVVYNGAGTQAIASGHPVNSNTLLDNGDVVYQVGNVTINGTLTQNVPLVIDSNTLTLGGPYVRNDQYFGILAGSSLILNGTGDMDLILAPVASALPNNPMTNLTINRTGVVTVGRSLIVEGTFTMTNGTFLLGAPFAFDLTLRGNVVRTAGTMAIVNNPNLTIEGTGSLPADFPIVLQTPTSYIGQLTMNRAGSTFNTSAVINLDTLNLFNGIVNNTASNLTMRSGGLIVRRSAGSVNQVLSAQTNYDVSYDVDTDVTSGNELPNVATALRNLTKAGTASVLLNKDIIINGRFTIEEGEFDAGVNNDITIRENFVIDGTFEPQQGLVTFAGGASQTISGTDTASFYNVAINQSPTSTVTISTPMMVENNLAVNSATSVNAGNDFLRILSGPTRTANVSQLAAGALINGRVIVERYLPKAVERRNYFHIASPVTNSTLADWNAEVLINRAFQWNELQDVYQQVGLGAAAVSGKGFTVDFRTSFSSRVDIRGTLRQGSIAVPVTTQSPGVVVGDDGWNLLGNPYPSAIDWDKVVLPPEVYDAVYVWDNFGNSGQGTEPGQIVSFVDGVGTPLGYDGEIAQGQAFWVKAVGNGSITFTESAKGTFTDANFYRKPELSNVLRITLAGAGVKDETVVRLRDGATANFDNKYDAYKYLKEGFRISTLTGDNVKAVINAFGTASCDRVIQLAAEDAHPGSFTLDFSGIESFESSVSVSLIDQVENKTIDIRNQPVYAFTVDADNVDLMETRFQLSLTANAQPVNTAISAQGETLCEDNSIARISLDASEVGVEYSVEWKGTKISEPIKGTGSAIQLEVNTQTLSFGENNVTVRAQPGVCSGAVLQTLPVITKVKRGEIKTVNDGGVCGQGSVTLRASGADTGGWYQWYESSDANQPVPGQQGPEFQTPSLAKSKTYYVSVVNALGCEGSRKPVTAVVSYPQDEVSLTSDGFILKSSSTEGNQWYLDGVLLEEQTSNTVEAVKSGLYTVTVSHGACKSTASIQISGSEEASDMISIFPNPTSDKVYIRVKSDNNNVTATMVNSQGVEIGAKNLIGQDGFKEAEFDLRSYAAGIYNVRVLDGRKVVIKKLAKIK